MKRTRHTKARRVVFPFALALASAAFAVPAAQASLEERGIVGAADNGIVAADDRTSRIVPGTGFAPPSVLPDNRDIRFTPGQGETRSVTPPDDRTIRFTPAGDGGTSVAAQIRDGFHWRDAWLGAAAGFGLALLLAGALTATLMTRRQERVAH